MTPNRILLDIETQRDFFHPAGACYTPHASEVAGSIYRLFRSARKRRLPVLSTVLRIRPGQLGPLAATPYCIEGSPGEKKMARTLLANRINLGLRNVTDLPQGIFRRYQQVIVEKRDTDIFKHARIERLITEMPPTTFIVCGAGVGQGIAQAVIGLRSLGFGVIVASDAVLTTDGPQYVLPMERMEAKGALLLPTDKIVLPPWPRVRVRRPAHARGARHWAAAARR